MNPEQQKHIAEIRARNEEHFMEGLRFLGGEDPEDMEEINISPDDPGYDEALDLAISQLFHCKIEDLHKEHKCTHQPEF